MFGTNDLTKIYVIAGYARKNCERRIKRLDDDIDIADSHGPAKEDYMYWLGKQSSAEAIIKAVGNFDEYLDWYTANKGNL